jgi:hypothetical protein
MSSRSAMDSYIVFDKLLTKADSLVLQNLAADLKVSPIQNDSTSLKQNYDSENGSTRLNTKDEALSSRSMAASVTSKFRHNEFTVIGNIN